MIKTHARTLRSGAHARTLSAQRVYRTRAAKGDSMERHALAAQAPRVDARTRSGVSVWCEDCNVAHTHAGATIGDTPEPVLGMRGVASTIAYAWCARERAYHYTSRRRGELNAPARGRWTQRVAQPSRPVTIVIGAAQAFIAAYDAQRTGAGMCVGNFAR